MQLFDNFYYAMMLISWFWMMGLPWQALAAFILTIYVSAVTLYAMFITLVYFYERGEGSNTDGFMQWYLLSNIVNWIFGTSIISTWMLSLTPYPVFGGLLNWFIYGGIYVNIYMNE